MIGSKTSTEGNQLTLLSRLTESLVGRRWGFFAAKLVLVVAGILVTACTQSEAPQQIGGHPATHDPDVVDAAYPPEMRELSFYSGGSKLNGLMYIANGPGPHPIVILLHGYAGNERNLDLAQAMRRAGNNVLYFNYRGTWGSGGEFSISHALEDVATAVELAREIRWASMYRSDPNQVALVGHSFGGFLGAITSAEDSDISCFAFLAGANVGAFGIQARGNDGVKAELEAVFGSDMDIDGGPINGDARQMVSEMVDRAEAYDIRSRALPLATRPLLLVAGERDESLPKQDHHDQVYAALRAAGAEQLTELVFDDDHSFSANRIELARRLVDWQQTECWR
jgi:dipeptidyl aminopeptidase/acylaminoacyl peptidase